MKALRGPKRIHWLRARVLKSLLTCLVDTNGVVGAATIQLQIFTILILSYLKRLLTGLCNRNVQKVCTIRCRIVGPQLSV